MSLEIISSEIIGFPRGEIGGGSASCDIEFRVTTNKPAPNHLVIERAQQADLIPARNETLGGTVPITVRGETYTDADLYASSFACEQLFTSERHALRHRITVTFATAELAAGSLTQNPYIGIDPKDRPLIRTVRFMVEQERITAAWNIDDVGKRTILGGPAAVPAREAGTLGPITNTAGAVVPVEMYRTVRYPVLVYKKYVTQLDTAKQINDQFENTYNGDSWGTYAKHHARFLQADIGDPEYWDGLERYPLTVEVATRSSPWYLDVPNVGGEVWDDDNKRFVQILDASGTPVIDVALDDFGLPNWGAPADILRYRSLKPANYNNLDTLLDNYN